MYIKLAVSEFFLIVNEANVQEHFPFPVSGQFKSRVFENNDYKNFYEIKTRDET